MFSHCSLMRAVRRDGSVSVGWVAGPPWKNRWCPRWRSCGPPRERRRSKHRQPNCTRLKIHYHPSSVTHHHRAWDSREKRSERKRERKSVWMWTADDVHYVPEESGWHKRGEETCHGTSCPKIQSWTQLISRYRELSPSSSSSSSSSSPPPPPPFRRK